MITSVIRKAKLSASLVLFVDCPDSSILVIVLWFGRNSESPAAADTTILLVFAVLRRGPTIRTFGRFSLGAATSDLGARAGIPGVAGCLGVPAKTIIFWKRAFFFARKRDFLLLLLCVHKEMGAGAARLI